jgi:hypothetical protein
MCRAPTRELEPHVTPQAGRKVANFAHAQHSKHSAQALNERYGGVNGRLLGVPRCALPDLARAGTLATDLAK